VDDTAPMLNICEMCEASAGSDESITKPRVFTDTQ